MTDKEKPDNSTIRDSRTVPIDDMKDFVRMAFSALRTDGIMMLQSRAITRDKTEARILAIIDREAGEMKGGLIWTSELPRRSGWYWIRETQVDLPCIWISDVEGRNEDEDGWVWREDGARIFLTPGVRAECGDEMQDDYWLDWEWAGPIPEPSEDPLLQDR